MWKYIKRQINVIKSQDPAIHSSLEAWLYPSFKAHLYYKLSHALYQNKHFFWARLLSERAKRKTGIEIHPGAIVADTVFFDHGTGVVIGETAIVKDYVTLYHGVTLGGTGKDKGKRHPTVEEHVMIGTGAKVLGNITIGKNAKIGAGAVVVRNVQENTTVVGVLAKPIDTKK